MWTPPTCGNDVPRSPSNGSGGGAGTFANAKIDINGLERVYRLVVPEGIDSEKPAPLVFAFHGLLDSKDIMPWYTRLDDLAKKHGFILVYPNGRNRHWPLVVEWAKEDLDFFDALYAHVTSQYNVDLDRVYLAGMSNGAYFSNLLASQRSDKIAAIAAHSGGLGLVGLKELTVENKYAVLVIHGDADSIVPVREGRATRDAYQKWGHPVGYIEVPKFPHFWAHKIGVNDKIWKFFEEHPRK
jgi:polyhydroxybutyrate depolymerase